MRGALFDLLGGLALCCFGFAVMVAPPWLCSTSGGGIECLGGDAEPLPPWLAPAEAFALALGMPIFLLGFAVLARMARDGLLTIGPMPRSTPTSSSSARLRIVARIAGIAILVPATTIAFMLIGGLAAGMGLEAESLRLGCWATFLGVLGIPLIAVARRS